jgi:hypothetical protein
LTWADAVFERYDIIQFIKSPKYAHRNRTIGTEVKITNNTPLSKQWDKYLLNPKNRMDLCNFLSNSWLTTASEQLHAGEVFITSGEFSVAVECKMVKYQAVSDHNLILALHYLGLPVVGWMH